MESEPLLYEPVRPRPLILDFQSAVIGSLFGVAMGMWFGLCIGTALVYSLVSHNNV